MTNKKEKKNALKKMLNEKPLFEMSGGGDLDPNVTNIPGDVTLGGVNGAGGKPITELLDNILGFNTTNTNLIKALGGTKDDDESSGTSGSTSSFFDIIKDLDKITEINEKLPAFIKDKTSPVTAQELQANGIMGFPLYIANQISKSTGIYNPVLPTGMTPEELFGTGSIFDLGHIHDEDKQDLEELSGSGYNNSGRNRYLTLYDLITDNNGRFLSPDVQFILDRFSSLAQFKHLPALEYLIQSGGQKSNSTPKKNKSRKVRK